MRVVAKYFPDKTPPLLQLSVFDAPHRRMHIKVIQQYRQKLYEACKGIGVPVPLETPVDLSILWVEPSSPDMGNLYLALEQALDGSTLTKANAVLKDDSLIDKTTMSKYYPYTGGKRK